MMQHNAKGVGIIRARALEALSISSRYTVVEAFFDYRGIKIEFKIEVDIVPSYGSARASPPPMVG